MQKINGDKPHKPSFCTIIDAETSSFSYLACSNCNLTLPNPPICSSCSAKYTSPISFKRLYRILLFVAFSDKIVPVICFDRAARALIGCSAEEFFEFCKFNPFAAEKMGEILEGEMCRMTLCEPKNGNARDLRAVSVVPLRDGFCPVIHTLRLVYGVDSSCRSLN